MPANATTAATTVVALYDDAADAARAADAVRAARIAGARVHRIDPDSGEAERLAVDGLPAGALDPYLAGLGHGRTLVAVEIDPSDAGKVDAILRQFRPVEAEAAAPPADDDVLPPSVQSTAAQTGRPRGHRDPSA